MFDNLKGMASLAGLVKDMPRIKERLDEVKERLGKTTVTAETGGGAVTATANGKMELIGLVVDRALLSGLVDTDDPDDHSMAEALIVGAVNGAMQKAREVAAAELQQAAQEFGLPLPPGGLSGGLGGLLS